MCGITGFYGFEDHELLKRMTDILTHRGPDQSGYYVDNICSLGHRRLSIIDLSEKGRQPISNEDGSIWVTFNGEIYNFQELRENLEKKGHKFTSNTDTEVIVHAYEEWKEYCVNMFNGCFGFAIYDSNSKSLLLARDRMGIKPLYYTFIGRNMLFASEIKSLLEHHEIKREVNRDALNSYLSFFTNTTNETMFTGIFKLSPGYCLKLQNNKITTKRYWDIPLYEQTNHKKQLFPILKDSVKLRLMSDVPLGIYLSGGVDSGTVTSLMSNFSDNIKTFSVGFDVNDYDWELQKAKVTADYFNTDHKEIIVSAKYITELPKIVWHLDEPMADPTSIPTYLLSREAKKSVTVVLTGEGADEQFAGYEQEKFMMLHKKYVQKVPLLFRKRLSNVIQAVPAKQLNYLFKYMGNLGDEGKKRAAQFLATNNSADALMSMISIFSEEEKQLLISGTGLFDYFNKTNINKKFKKEFFTNDEPFLSQLLRFENKVILTENLLMKVDKNTMAHGIEARVPFLDHRIVEFAAGLEEKQKLRGLRDKYILRKTMKPYLPKETAMQKKERFFVPVDVWLKKDLQPIIEQLLNKSTITKQGFFNHYYIQKALDNYHRSPLFYGRQLWTLLHFQMWHKMFIEREKVRI